MTSPHVAHRAAIRAPKNRCAPTPVAPAASFAREVDMIAPIVAAATKLTRGLPATSAHTYLEVPFAGGVPDVVIVSFNEAAIRRRLEADLGPVTSLSEVRVLDGLAAGRTDLADLAAHTGLSRAHLRRTVLPLLAQAGWTEPLGGRASEVQARFPHEPLTHWVVSVEVKRTAWATAVAQARRHLLAADRAFIAIDARRAGRAIAAAPHLARQGVGVATVAAPDPDSPNDCLGWAGVVSYPDDRRPGLPAPGRSTRAVDRRLVAERVWDLRLRGVRSGPTYPVFGRDLSA